MMTRFDKATPFSYSRPMKMFRFFTLIVLCLLFPASLTVLAQTNGLELLQFKERNGIVVEGDVGEVSLLPYAMNFLDAQSVSLDFSFLQSDAGFSSAFGIAFLDGNNEPVGGEVIRANVKDFGDVSRTISQSEWNTLGATKLTTFVLADSARKNDWVNDGDAVSFLKEADETYEVFVDGTKLKHADQGALFGDFTLNPGGFPNMTDLPPADGYYEGSMDWEDRHALSDRSDFDFNDISLDMGVLVEDAQGNFIDGTNWAGVLIGSLLRRANDGQRWGEAISDRILISDGSMCFNAENAPGGLVGLANINRELPPEDVTTDKEIMYGVYVSEDLTTGYIIESGKKKREINLSGNEQRFCIYREGEGIRYELNGQTVHTSLWPMPEGDVLFADVLLTIPESYIENLEGENFVDNNLRPDDDRDGVPDAWEIENGLNPNSVADATQDPDGDGLQNFMEYADGSDPNVPNYEAMPTDYLWWMKGSFLDSGNGWIDLSGYEHSATNVTGIDKVEENNRQYAYLDSGDEITVGAGTGNWIPDPQTNAMESVGFSLMVALKPLWAGWGYENLIDLSSGSSSNGGFRLGIEDGLWVVDSPGQEGLYLDNVEHPVTLNENTVLVIRYSENGLLEVFVDGVRNTWMAQSLIKNITGEGKIHALNGNLTRVENIDWKERILEALTSLLTSSAYAQESGNDAFAMIQEIILYGRTVSYAEVLTLNATYATVTDETLFQTWADYCGDFEGDPNADPDGDGFSIMEEVFMGLDPSNVDTFELNILNRFNGGIELRWHGASGRMYEVEDNLDLLNPSGWLNSHIVNGNNLEVELFMVPNQYPHYWRLKYVGAVDSDGDELPDWLEECLGSDPESTDSDGDGISDTAAINTGMHPNHRLDSDGDGLPDWWEVKYGLDHQDATGDNGAYADIEGDRLTNLEEYQHDLDPKNPDTDGDHVSDLIETLTDDPNVTGFPQPIYYDAVSGTYTYNERYSGGFGTYDQISYGWITSDGFVPDITQPAQEIYYSKINMHYWNLWPNQPYMYRYYNSDFSFIHYTIIGYGWTTPDGFIPDLTRPSEAINYSRINLSRWVDEPETPYTYHLYDSHYHWFNLYTVGYGWPTSDGFIPDLTRPSEPINYSRINMGQWDNQPETPYAYHYYDSVWWMLGLNTVAYGWLTPGGFIADLTRASEPIYYSRINMAQWSNQPETPYMYHYLDNAMNPPFDLAGYGWTTLEGFAPDFSQPAQPIYFELVNYHYLYTATPTRPSNTRIATIMATVPLPLAGFSTTVIITKMEPSIILIPTTTACPTTGNNNTASTFPTLPATTAQTATPTTTTSPTWKNTSMEPTRATLFPIAKIMTTTGCLTATKKNTALTPKTLPTPTLTPTTMA